MSLFLKFPALQNLWKNLLNLFLFSEWALKWMKNLTEQSASQKTLLLLLLLLLSLLLLLTTSRQRRKFPTKNLSSIFRCLHSLAPWCSALGARLMSLGVHYKAATKTTNFPTAVVAPSLAVGCWRWQRRVGLPAFLYNTIDLFTFYEYNLFLLHYFTLYIL